MKLKSGVDLIEIARIEGSIINHGDLFLSRIFTPRELAEVGENASSLAARFAAKEAVSKALGVGIGDVGWKDIEVLRGQNGEPTLVLHASAQELAAKLGLTTWSLSLSHSKNYAIAMVVALG